MLYTWGNIKFCIGFDLDFLASATFWRLWLDQEVSLLYAHVSLKARGTKNNFFWPVSSQFAILRADLWVHCRKIDRNGYMSLMNVMCNMSQFVVVVPVLDESSATLASYSMQHVLSKFSLCHLVVLDKGTSFKGAFIDMRESLYLNHDVLTKRIYKGLTVEHFHRFLNERHHSRWRARY